eukprot:1683555-Prymnesium_polylepis.1
MAGCRVAAARCAPQPEGAMGAQKRVSLRVFRARRSQGVCGRPPSTCARSVGTFLVCSSGGYGDFKTNATPPAAYTTSQSIAWRYQKRLETLSSSTVESHTSSEIAPKQKNATAHGKRGM